MVSAIAGGPYLMAAAKAAPSPIFDRSRLPRSPVPGAWASERGGADGRLGDGADAPGLGLRLFPGFEGGEAFRRDLGRDDLTVVGLHGGFVGVAR